MNLNPEISKTFNKHATEYDKAAKIQYEIGSRLFERLDYLKISPRHILDLGCGTGFFTQQLKKKYPNAVVIGVDLAYLMLAEARKKQRLWRRWPLLNADMQSLPFATGTFDLIFANQVIHWATSSNLVMSELNRVMNINGCLMFSTLGPDTFKELKAAWNNVDEFAHANIFSDMHDIGDVLLKERFVDPVVDMEMITAHYSSVLDLVKGLKAQGVRNINLQRNPGMTGKNTWKKFELAYQAYSTDNKKIPLTYEVIYGHAWRGELQQTNGTETYIPISQIKKSVINNSK